MSAADRIRERNQKLRGFEQEAVEVIEDFYEENREEIEDSGFDIPDVPEPEDAEELEGSNEEESLDLDEIKRELDEEDEDDQPTAAVDLSGGSMYEEGSLERRFEKMIEEETRFDWMGGLVKGTVESVVEDRELGSTSFQADSQEITRLEYENFADYFEQVADEIDVEDPDAAYLGAGGDTVPAASIGGDWKYVGLGYEEDGFEGDNVTIDFVNQDLTEGFPQVEDGSLDLVMIKTLGSAPEEVDEAAREQAYNKVSEDGYVVSDREIEGMEKVQDIQPVPETFSMRLGDPQTGAMIYNASELTVYEK